MSKERQRQKGGAIMGNDKYTTPEQAYSQMLKISEKSSVPPQKQKEGSPKQSRERMIQRQQTKPKNE